MLPLHTMHAFNYAHATSRTEGYNLLTRNMHVSEPKQLLIVHSHEAPIPGFTT